MVCFPGRASAAYRVGPADVLDLAVTQEPKLTGKFTVDDQGAVSLELLGRVDVAGRTTEEIDKLLAEKLKTYFKSPSVRVAVAEYHSQKVYVLGAVSRPGAYVLSGERTLLDEVLEAGGTTPGATGRLVLVRAGSEVAARVATNGAAVPGGDESVVIDLPKLLAGGPVGATNVPVHNGDFVLVPGAEASAGGTVVDSGEAQVTVVGEVQHPGLFRLEPGATALAAVLAAGGVTKYASPNRAKVIRAREGARSVIDLALGDILKHGDKKKDVVLEPGDMVIVPARLF
ncbi:MAG TPA: polysaccharide biosynthesis/export family protein [bacterium]|nr:polysaccharide biosynthesis/export family protein [bacterium]